MVCIPCLEREECEHVEGHVSGIQLPTELQHVGQKNYVWRGHLAMPSYIGQTPLPPNQAGPEAFVQV